MAESSPSTADEAGTPLKRVRARITAGEFEKATVPNDALTAVVDTNVVIDMYSCHDLARAVPARHRYRYDRARDSLLLAIYFDQERADTCGLFELLDVLAERVPPDAVDTIERQFTTTFVHFVRGHVVGRWTRRAWAGGMPRGNEADRRLLLLAQEIGKPLITYEKRLTAKALESGIDALEPRAFFERGGFDAVRGAQRFLARFKSVARQYANEHEHADPWMHHLGQLYDFYRKLLLDCG